MQQPTNNKIDYSEAVALWRAVIAQAIKDYQGTSGRVDQRKYKKDAEAFLRLDNTSFLEVCTLANLNPSAVLMRLQTNKRISTKRINKGGRRFLA